MYSWKLYFICITPLLLLVPLLFLPLSTSWLLWSEQLSCCPLRQRFYLNLTIADHEPKPASSWSKNTYFVLWVTFSKCSVVVSASWTIHTVSWEWALVSHTPLLHKSAMGDRWGRIDTHWLYQEILQSEAPRQSPYYKVWQNPLYSTAVPRVYKFFSDCPDHYTRQTDYGFHQLPDNFSFFQYLFALSKKYTSRLKAIFAWKNLDHNWQYLFILSLLGHRLYLDKPACVLFYPTHVVKGT